jgi:hypothetical protein
MARHPREHGCGSSLSRPTRRRLLAGAAGLAAGSCLLSGAAPSAATLLDIQPFAGRCTDPGGVPLNGRRTAPRRTARW